MSKRVTRNDVARRAGVSSAVVSYVINQSKHVSEEKTLAVKKAIEELNYKPNIYARSLKMNRTMQIAFVCDNLRNDWLEIPEKQFEKKGFFVSHSYSRDDDDFIDMLVSGRFDGVFMLSNRYSASQLNRIARADIPIVLYKTRDYSYLEPNIVSVAPDIYNGMIKTINYLAFRGHKRILLVPPIRYNMSVNVNKGFREQAYREALRSNHLEVDESLICRQTDSIQSIKSEVFNRVFEQKPEDRPTAIVAGDDYLAGRIMQYLRELGLVVPKDVAVVGMDNTYLSELLSPKLTSVDFSKEDFSEKLVNTMIALINGEKPQDQLIPVSLAVRESA